MDKIKPDTNALSSWTTKYKGPYVLSCKLDGVSGMYSTEDSTAKLYTRGNGSVGQDITSLLSAIDLPKQSGIVVRGEFILPKKLFDEKYKNTFANPRNLVSGIINSKTVDGKAKDLHFVAYEVIKPELRPSEQMSKLKEWGFEVVKNRTETTLSNEMLSETLLDWRKNHEYEIDGIIVSNDEIYKRTTSNPEHAFAFKMVMGDQMAEVKVVDVIWEASKDGYLKPRVRVEPVKIGGVTVEYATGFNGNFIESNKIGVGAIIQLIRSGDVIPYIKSVSVPAEEAKMPSVSYHWNDTHVDVILDDVADDVTVKEKNIASFFTTLEVDGLSRGNVKRIMNAGYDTIPKILRMEKADFEKVEGFKSKMVDKLYDGIRAKIQNATLLDIMTASNMFGRGISRAKLVPIMAQHPDILKMTESDEQKRAMVKAVSGIGPENSKAFVEHIPAFLQFLRECDLESKLNAPTVQAPKKDVDTSHPLYNKHIVMTKVRDQGVIELLDRVGGFLDDSIGKNTFVLVVKSKDDVSNKTKYAVEHNIPIMTPDEFRGTYGIREPTVPL